MQQTLVFLAVLIVAVAIYWPILKKARGDISARSAAGMGNGLLFAVLLIPLFGPIIYLIFRKKFSVK
ncbi:hypothetical protein FUA23_10790 [Neolewinella aurantiaca]|uniref:Uncharacterized protein n=1 Tax=Neolewinella aurantiaca TaxID=2602767 RepID=A0A5C7FI02_9BACT|nr:hypothetical protein [Neolewinella aurantiaca]TXF89444.1 hypothetical protein FUA23_10790 [Neolewinella aurantiaca]